MQSRDANVRKRGMFTAVVLVNRRLCDQHHLLALDMGTDFPATRPGQFVQLLCRAQDAPVDPVYHEWQAPDAPELILPELTDKQTLLRRPFSLAGRHVRDGRIVLEIIHRVVGTGSKYLSTLKPGDQVDLLGPLGNAFHWHENTRSAVLVGGGVGTPPMLYLAEALYNAGKQVMAFFGATSSNLLPLSFDADATVSTAGWPSLCVHELTRFNTEAAVCTDDGSLGFPGRVTEALWRWLDQHRFNPDETIVYTCGPEPMMRAVAEGSLQRGLKCQVAMERHMACGMGTCQSCVCRTVSDNVSGWQYKLVCTDGPVFDAHQLVWD